MIANSIFVTSILALACGFYVMGELTFLSPYRGFILHRYGAIIGWFALLAFVNLFAGILAVNRKLFLKDTGRKLAHVEKQLRTGSSISEELSERLAE
ncbi:MAG: hypothetical protein JWO80_5014 [Bryobacterales bacterium]|nr:hypothetical protein [Bryobacterales bacterium]